MAAHNGRLPHNDETGIVLSATFLSKLLPEIDDLAELKLSIFALSALQQKEGDYRYLRFDEFVADENLMRGLEAADKSISAHETLARALDKAIDRGTLLVAEAAIGEKITRFFTLNDEHGRTLHQQIQSGAWRPSVDDEIEVLPPRPSIYGLYEENLGVLTPMIVESIKDAEATYPRDWIEDAMRLAVERNARNWRYIKKILESWQQEGRSRETGGGHHRRPRQYTTGKWKDIVKS